MTEVNIDDLAKMSTVSPLTCYMMLVTALTLLRRPCRAPAFCLYGCLVWHQLGSDWPQMGQIWDFFNISLSTLC